jgi:hypothetical protein
MEDFKAKRDKMYDQEGVNELMRRVKRYILTYREEALSVYANLGRSGKHIIWVPTKR